jgi:leucyl/phenylalanyl-tRNA--protein transferase
MIPWLVDDAPFPSVESALVDPNGLLCAGGNLSPERILSAYRQGIFPWFSAGQPILWWSPDPRMVLFPDEFKVSRSLRKTLKSGHYEIRLDNDFAGVINRCAHTERPGQPGTWITPEMRNAYLRLHELGWAHSVETWQEGILTGGLYGLAIGKMFYGESMFSLRSDASKIAAAHLARFLGYQEFGMVDCQMRTDHLASLGAREIPRVVFLEQLQRLCQVPATPARWPVAGAVFDWS